MIDLYYWTTPNGHKITIFLEETGLPYTIKPVNISQGRAVRSGSSSKISPNNRIPAIVDHAPSDGGEPLSLFESGAILEYLAAKTGTLRAAGLPRPWECLQWLYLADGQPRTDGRAEPSLRALRAGQASLCDRPLRERDGSPLSRARPAPCGSCVPRRRILDRRHRELSVGSPRAPGAGHRRVPAISSAGRLSIRARPAVQRAYELAQTVNPKPVINDEESRRVLFGQSKDTVK